MRSLDMNPVYQNLRLSLSQADADLAAIRGQMQAQQAVVGELRSRVKPIPEVEAELARLNRDYEINKSSTTRWCSDSSRRRSPSRRSRAPTTSSSGSSSRRPCRSSRAVRSVGAQSAGVARGARRRHRPGRAARAAASDVRDARHAAEGHRRSGHRCRSRRRCQSSLVPWYRRQAVLVGAAVSLLLVVFVLNLVLSEPLRAVLRAVVG